MAVHLLILGERDGLRWVLENERMAFPAHRRTQLAHVRPGDDLLLYTTRGCFHNPTRDRGRIIGRARVKSAVEILGEPVTIGDREYAIGCDLSLLQLLPFGEGHRPGGLRRATGRVPAPACLERDATTLAPHASGG